MRDINTDNLSFTSTFSTTNLEQKVSKLQRLQALLQRYQAIKQYGETLEKHNKALERNKELKHFLKEWRYNKDNPDPDVDLGNGKFRITVWKAAPDED